MEMRRSVAEVKTKFYLQNTVVPRYELPKLLLGIKEVEISMALNQFVMGILAMEICV
jgi:hypothetical protein